jgi:hypothetical protein
MVCLLNGVHLAVWESCGGAEAGHWGGMVGLVSASALLGGMECAAVKLVAEGCTEHAGSGSCGVVNAWRWVAWGGMKCRHCAGWYMWTAQRV